MNWNECIQKNTAKRISPDYERAKALQKTARARIQHIRNNNPNFLFEDYYSSIQELIHAHAFTKGYNILNHICVGYYVRDVLGREDLFFIFDDLRYKRNALTYYGILMDTKTAKKTILDCKKLFAELL